jgi:uncharacterized protein involved in exopolysaccharide biosynthesis/MinD-like ATPase involved in chromosome partitioning or flagellar assembly
VTDELDIGASLRRRQTSSGEQAPPGESAWDLPEATGDSQHDDAALCDGIDQTEHEPHPDAPSLDDEALASAPQPSKGTPSPVRDDIKSSRGGGRRGGARSESEWDSGGLEDPNDDVGIAGQDAPFPPFPGFGDDEDAGPTGPGFDIMRFARGIWKRKFLIIIITSIVMVLFLMLALALPREWRAKTTLITESEQAAFQVSGARPFQPQHYDLQTFIDTIKLPSSLDETMRRAGISVMRRTLAGAIEVWFGDDSNVFSINVTWDDPEMAARIANIVAELFMENSARIKLGNTKASYDEYSEQLNKARADFQRINDALIAFAEQHQIASLNDQISVLVGLVTQTEASYNANIAKVEALRAAKRRIDEQFEAEPEMIVTQTLYRSPFKQRLSEYQWELKEARTRYTERNPKIIRLKKRIETLEQLIADSGDEVAPENVYEINPKRGDLFLRKQETDDQLEVAEAGANAERETLEESRSELSRLLAARAGWEELNAQSKDSARLVDSLGARLAEVRVAMQQVNSGFSVLEKASPPDLPEPSLRKIVAAAGVILGSGFALFVALLLELLDPIVRTARDAQNITRCRLVLEFECTPTPEDATIVPNAPTAPVAALFRRIVNDLRTALEPDEWKQLAVISPEPHTGRTLTAVNLAAALGQQESEALVVDADLRVTAGPRPDKMLGRQAVADELSDDVPERGERFGLSDVLADRATLEQAISNTAHPGVQVLRGMSGSSEALDDDDIDLLKLGSKAFVELNQELSAYPLTVFYDLPPITETESVWEAAAKVGQCLLVARSNETRRSDLKTVAEHLKARGVEIRAVLVTMIPETVLTRPSVFGARRNGTWLDRLLVSNLADF